MTASPALQPAGDLVPLAERMRSMRFVRYAMVALVGIIGAIGQSPRVLSLPLLAAGTGVYLGVALCSDLAWHRSKRRGLTLFGVMLIADGAFLAWATYATGTSLSPVRYLILLHLIAVVLLASYRTGLKLAMWHSLLLFVVFYAQQAEIVRPVPHSMQSVPGTEYGRLGAFVVSLWLVTVATAALSAINERELRRRRLDLESLAQLGADLEGANDSFDVADILLDRISATFEVERILLLGAPDVDLLLLARRGSEQAIGSICPVGAASALVRAWEARETVLVSEFDAEADPWLASSLPDGRNIIITPLTAEGRSVGVLIIEHAHRNGSRVERRVVGMIERFAAHSGLALRNAWLLEQVQRMATTDGLTGIANRRSFDTTLEREVSRAARKGEPVSLVMLDLDHFKVLNDTYGHQTGDEVLRQAADAIAAHCRDFDTAARYGGEEFAVIIPGSGVAESLIAAERLHQLIGGRDGAVPVSASVGVATFPDHASDASSLLKAADDALYRSKRTGRDKVTAASTLVDDPGAPEADPVAAFVANAVVPSPASHRTPVSALADAAEPGASGRALAAVESPAPGGHDDGRRSPPPTTGPDLGAVAITEDAGDAVPAVPTVDEVELGGAASGGLVTGVGHDGHDELPALDPVSVRSRRN